MNSCFGQSFSIKDIMRNKKDEHILSAGDSATYVIFLVFVENVNCILFYVVEFVT